MVDPASSITSSVPGKNLVGANDLQAQPLDGIREHAVHFLRLAARHARYFRRIAHDAA